ncbi:glycosyltransferase [Candidatus Uabimicrobium amorphum]|uniref:Glycosyl transferase n=1 Tax=Uabimicrobium amorphum TaxID=2596890 RepID=A0A5S9F2B3_UABAM|nr:glycosyltransferase [Candidatus Uabimicrobium amorphum]BBM83288.1 glycosyl transferase [Candidatus Uabimicrobium amorphum]
MENVRLRILHVSPSYYPAFCYGGPIHSVHLLNKNLVKQGQDVDVITSNAGLRDQNIALNKWQKVDDVRVMYFKYYGYHHFTFSPRMFAYLLRVVKNYDIVHITAVWNFPVVAACIACCIHKIPFIISPRGTIYPKTLLTKSRYLKKLYYYLVARRCLNSSAALHFTTTDEQQKVQKFLQLKAKGFVVANGIELEEFSPSTMNFSEHYLGKKTTKYILFLSRLSWKKGIDLLLPAYAKFCKKYDDVCLVIAGPDEDNYTQFLHSIIQKYDIETRVVFTGLINGEARVAAYQNAQCFILPSYSENFGMVAIEALACRTPIIISDQVGIFIEVQKHDAGLICETKVESVYNALESIWRSSHEEMVENGYTLVKNFYAAQRTALLMLQNYRKIIREKQ